MSASREEILSTIVAELGTEDYIHAIWLEGSDGTGQVDAFSDIDLVCYSKEGFVDRMISKLDDCLARLGTLDIAYEGPGRADNNRYKVYHLQGTPESLLVDVTFQSDSFPVGFLREDETVVPVVLLDRAGIVKYRDLDKASYRADLLTQLENAKGVYSQSSRALKYTLRGLFLESLIYYHKFVLGPLVDVYRILHTPFQADCFLVHATRDFPPDIVSVLEKLYAVKTIEDISAGLNLANKLFDKATREAEQLLQQPDFP